VKSKGIAQNAFKESKVVFIEVLLC
jgi:hypothetical protein